MSQERLQELAKQLSQESGKECIYQATGSLWDAKAYIRQEMGLDLNALEFRCIEDSVFVLAPEGWDEWDTEDYE